MTSYVVLRSKYLRSFREENSTVQLGTAATAELMRPIAYTNVSELLGCGSLLVVWSRKFEREMGSRQLIKLAVCVAVFAVLWLGRAESYLTNIHRPDGSKDSSSFRFFDAYLGALLWHFYAYTPRVHPRFISLWGGRLHGSEKILYYAWFLYGCWTLLASSSSSWLFISYYRPLLAVLVGTVVGALFPAVLSRWVIIPDRLASWAATRIGNHVQPPPRMWVPTFGGGAAAAAGGGAGGRYAPNRGPNPISHLAAAAAMAPMAAPPPRAVVAPPETMILPADPDAIETLVGMGFERQRVVRALEATGNDVQRAADRLLSGAA
jgi:hypothetical protein